MYCILPMWSQTDFQFSPFFNNKNTTTKSLFIIYFIENILQAVIRLNIPPIQHLLPV